MRACMRRIVSRSLLSPPDSHISARVPSSRCCAAHVRRRFSVALSSSQLWPYSLNARLAALVEISTSYHISELATKVQMELPSTPDNPHSPLLALPAELRLKIFWTVLYRPLRSNKWYLTSPWLAAKSAAKFSLLYLRMSLFSGVWKDW